jgi:hypothetical protein
MSQHAFLYESSDIPAGMTLREWRVAREAQRPRRRRVRALLARHPPRLAPGFQR